MRNGHFGQVSLKAMKADRLATAAVVILTLLIVPEAMASPEYAEETGQVCAACHLDPEGGELSPTGLAFAASGYVWPPQGGYRVLGPTRKAGRFVVGFLHILGSFMWFGTILYVHILLRPAYAAKGLPRGEVAVGLVCMVVVGLTGLLLTLSKVRSAGVLFQSTWGILLLVKIFLYLFMVGSALTVVLFVGPRLRSPRKRPVIPADGIFDPVTLGAFDGKEGRGAYAAVAGTVYDLSASPFWKGGLHMKHQAGGDMTSAIARAPHDREKLGGFPVVGSFDASRIPPKSAAQKAFYVVAYMNLSIVFIVLGVIAYWRWGI